MFGPRGRRGLVIYTDSPRPQKPRESRLSERLEMVSARWARPGLRDNRRRPRTQPKARSCSLSGAKRAFRSGCRPRLPRHPPRLPRSSQGATHARPPWTHLWPRTRPSGVGRRSSRGRTNRRGPPWGLPALPARARPPFRPEPLGQCSSPGGGSGPQGPIPPVQAWLRLSPVGDSHREREEEEATRTDLDSVTGTRESHCSRTESEVPGRWPWWLARLQVAPLRVGLAQRLPLSLSEGPTGAG